MSEISHVVAAVQVAFAILAARLLALVALITTCVLFGWAMAATSWLHFTVAVSYAALVFLPALYLSGRAGPRERSSGNTG